MISYEVSDLGVESVENLGVSGDEGGFVAITSGEVLRGDDTYLFSGLRLNEKNLRVVVG